MKIVTEDFLLELSYASNVEIPDKSIEALVRLEAPEAKPGSPAHYYRFFYFLVECFPDTFTALELGTWKGISARCLANHPDGEVHTLDNASDSLIEQPPYHNITFINRDSLNKISIKSLDLLFIDTEHDGVRCQKEFDLYKDDVVPGGLVFFDDVYLNDEMRKFWDNFNPDGYEKFDLPVHGEAGFGCLIKARG